MTDDQAKKTMSCYGSSYIQTPHMDSIGSGGMRFDEAFVTNALCGPSRGTYLTGQYSHIHGVHSNAPVLDLPPPQGLSASQITFPKLLGEAGYHTGVVGKWHLPQLPPYFHYHSILPAQGAYFDTPFITNGVAKRESGYADDVITDRAIEFINRRPVDRPFCLLYHFKAPHANWEPHPRYESLLENVEIALPPTFDEAPANHPAHLAKAKNKVENLAHFYDRGVDRTLPKDERKRANYQALVKNYHRVLKGADDNIGRVLKHLAAIGELDDTLIIFCSDNGYFLGEKGFYDKRLMYEPAIRVPLMMRYPRLIQPSQVNRTHMVLNIDVAPTILDLCGLQPHPGMQGVTMRPLLEGRAVPWRKEFYYQFFEYPGVHCVRKHRGIRTADWKLIHYWEKPDSFELFHLKTDPDEVKNLFDDFKHRDQKNRLMIQLRLLQEKVKDTSYPELTARPCTS